MNIIIIVLIPHLERVYNCVQVGLPQHNKHIKKKSILDFNPCENILWS